MSLLDPIGVFSGGGGLPGLPNLPMPPMPPGLPGLPGFGGQQQQGQMGGMPSGLGGTMQTQNAGDLGYQQNLSGLLQMMGGNQANPANMNLMRGGLI